MDYVTIEKCVIHNKHERFVKYLSWWCFECGHTYKTRLHVLLRDLRSLGGWWTLARIRLAWNPSFCPLCLHDW
jgi:hypothetical protein